MACVYIPVQNSEEEVRVSLDQLPRDATDILDILKAEQAPLDLWLVIAREYFKQGKIEQFCQILEEGSSPEIEEYYADVKYERIAILNALGAYYSYLGKIETSLKEKDNHFAMATQYYNRASRVDMHESSTWVGKGQLLLAKGDVEQAFNTFKIVLDGDPDNVPALLGQASVQFNRGRYSESLELYKRALRVYPDCPGAVRLGIGLCRYKLGHFEKARQAFERVLQLDPENVEALVALGVMDLHANDAAGIRRGMERMLIAFEIYPYNALSLNYLANHFFFTGQHFLVEQLTETALAVTNHGPTKAHSYYNLARSYHSKGDYEKAGRYYMASVKESSKPQEFVLPYYGLGQVQLKLGDYRSALSNFEKVLEVYPENCETLMALGHIYALLNQTDKALEVLRKVTRIDPRDAQTFLDLGDILISSDTGAGLEAYKTARSLLRKAGEDVPIELLNNIGVLHLERGEFELAEQTFKDALGSGVWLSLINGKENNYAVDAVTALLQCKDMQIFRHLEEEGISVELPWNKVSAVFNLARLNEELHKTLSAILLYRLILYKYPEYVDALLRLAAIAKARSNIQLSIELVGEALRVNDKCPTSLAILGCLELKNDEWVKAKETFRAASEATDGKDFYASVCLGNWNYFAALVSELKKQVKHIPVHLEKAKDIYSNVLKKCSNNLYAANGLGMILAEKGQFDVSKEIFTQVQEAGSGSIFSPMPDVWINLAHVYFAQGNFTLAVKMYQNCLRKFFYNTESQLLLYLARTYYEAEQWQDSKRALLRAMHLSPSNYTLRFNLGVVMQKFSASLLNKEKRSADEMRTTVAELETAIRLFGQLAVAFSQNIHGIDEKKIETHVSYCKHLLDVAKVYREAAELEEQQSKQRLELARQVTLAEEARRKAEEQQKLQMEKRKQEEELKRVKEMEERFERVKEQLKSSSQGSKRKERAQSEDEDGEHSEKKRRKGGKKKKRDKSEKSHYEEVEAGRVEYQEDMDEPHSDYGEPNRLNTAYDDREEDHVQDPLAAVGLEDSSETLKKIGGITAVDFAGNQSSMSIQSSDQTTTSSSTRSEFNKKASRIGLGIHEANRKIARLSQLAKKSSMFNDPTAEIQELTALIKNDITALNVAFADLQNIQNIEVSRSYTDDKVFHTNAICDDLKNRLMAATKRFQEVLTARTQNIKAHETRKQLFSANGSRENPFQQPAKPITEPPPWSNSSKVSASAQPSGPTIAPSSGVQAGSQLRRRMGPETLPSNNMEMSMLQQAAPQQEDLSRNRSTALQNVESTISELSGIFTHLATVVAQQGELAIRIDDNMEESLSNVEGAHSSLLKHLTRISSNRSLLIKLFAVLILFLVVFIFFVV